MSQYIGNDYARHDLPPSPPRQTKDKAGDVAVGTHFSTDTTSPRTAVNNDLEASYAAPAQQEFTSYEKKRETLNLEEGLPPILRPKRSGRKHHGAHRKLLKKRLAIKNKLVLFLCEFVGTTMFLFFSFGIASQATASITAAATVSAIPDVNGLLFSSLGFGFSLAVNAWVWFRVTGSLFNPALTLGLTLLGSLDWVECVTLHFSQFAGAIAAAGLTAGLFPEGLNARATLGSGTTVNQGFWIEFFSTSLLLFAVYMLAGEKHKGTFLAPVGIGLALFLGELLATRYTGGSLNPARSLGPDVVARKFDSFAWIYYVAPYFATLVTTAFYKALVWLNYQTIVPGMDAEEDEEQKQVIKDIYGNNIGVVEAVPSSSFSFASAYDNQNAANRHSLVAQEFHAQNATSPAPALVNSDSPYATSAPRTGHHQVADANAVSSAMSQGSSSPAHRLAGAL